MPTSLFDHGVDQFRRQPIEQRLHSHEDECLLEADGGGGGTMGKCRRPQDCCGKIGEHQLAKVGADASGLRPCPAIQPLR